MLHLPNESGWGNTVIRGKSYCAEENASFRLSRGPPLRPGERPVACADGLENQGCEWLLQVLGLQAQGINPGLCGEDETWAPWVTWLEIGSKLGAVGGDGISKQNGVTRVPFFT